MKLNKMQNDDEYKLSWQPCIYYNSLQFVVHKHEDQTSHF